MGWLRGFTDVAVDEGWRARARASLIDVNDGIVSAAGIAEGFASAGASPRAVLFAGVAVILAGAWPPPVRDTRRSRPRRR